MSIKRIISHWTGGSHTASSLDKEHYHFLIEGDGRVVRGVHTVEDNLSTSDGDYAKHTRGANTGAIGVAICAMAGAQERPFSPGRFPIKYEQWMSYITLIAELCYEYDIPITRETVLTHAEVEATLGVTQRGKWDISVMPFSNVYNDPYSVGDEIRELVGYELAQMVFSDDDDDDEEEETISSTTPIAKSCGDYYMSQRMGAREPCSTAIRERMNNWLDSLKMTSKRPTLSAKEQDVVRLFQAEHGLDDDGVVGPDTFGVLEKYV